VSVKAKGPFIHATQASKDKEAAALRRWQQDDLDQRFAEFEHEWGIKLPRLDLAYTPESHMPQHPDDPPKPSEALT